MIFKRISKLLSSSDRKITDNCCQSSDSITFGLIKTEPIPTNDISGEMAYLSSLHCPCKEPFTFHRLCSFKMNNDKGEVIIDCYELLCRKGTHHYFLYFDMYHPQTSKKVPNNLTFGSPEGRGWNNFLPDFDTIKFDLILSHILKADRYKKDIWLLGDSNKMLAHSNEMLLARDYMDKNDINNAIQHLDMALLIDHKWEQLWIYKKRALIHLGKIDEIRSWCDKAKIVFPNTWKSICKDNDI